MRMFTIDPQAARSTFERQGWVHLIAVARPEFVDATRERIARVLAEPVHTVGGNALNKVQFRLDFDDLAAVQGEVFSVFGPLSGHRPESLTLSERHVNVYRDSASADPVPHKDRRASQVTIGVTIDVQEGSHLVLWPQVDRDENVHASAADLYHSLPAARRPEHVLRDATPVSVFDRPGDVVVFAGSTTWHCRRQAAGTTNLFFKVNDFGDDPLGEDARATQAAAG